MFNSPLKLFFVLIFLLIHIHVSLSFEKICYYTNWSQYRSERGYGFYPEDIDASLCTHIIYAFGKIEDDTIVNFEDNDVSIDGGPGMFNRIMKLKDNQPDLKIMLAIGGWNAGSYPFEQIIKDQNRMNSFARNVVDFLRKWNFDGLDVDWEFPTLRKTQFSNLLEALRLAFELDAITSSLEKLLLSTALSAGQATIDTSYEIKKINELVDFVNLMTYDLHGSWESKTGFHTALYARKDEKDWEKTLNIDWAVKYLIKLGMSKQKIMLGLGLYGRSFNLVNQNFTEPGLPAIGSPPPGKITAESGILAYYEICMLINNGSISKWNDEQKSNSVQSGKTWIGYDDKQALILKVQYALQNCLGGIMVWSLDLDDFKGLYCKSGRYPLLNTINDAIMNNGLNTTCLSTNVTSTTKQQTTLSFSTSTFSLTSSTLASTLTTFSASSTSTTTPESVEEILCNNETELLSDINDCSSFYVCLSGIQNPLGKLKCPESMWFDIVVNTCVRTIPYRCKPLSVDIEKLSTSTSTSTTTSTPTTRTSTTSMSSSTSTSTTSTTTLITTVTKTVKSTDSVTTSTFTSTNPFTSKSISNSTNVILSTLASTEIIPDNLSFSILTIENSSIKTTLNVSEILTTTTLMTTSDNVENKSYDEGFICPDLFGLYPQKHDCASFIICSNSKPLQQSCPSGLVFNPDIQSCDYKSPLCSDYNFYTNNKNLKKNSVLNEFICPKEKGLFANEKDCSTFWNCADNIQILMECPPTLVFNSKEGVCDYSSECNTKSKIIRKRIKKIKRF